MSSVDMTEFNRQRFEREVAEELGLDRRRAMSAERICIHCTKGKVRRGETYKQARERCWACPHWHGELWEVRAAQEGRP